MPAAAPGAAPRGDAAAAASPAPWQVPADAYGSQSLYRVTVTGSEGDGSVKLTLRLAAPDRFQAQAADPLGRGLWDLDVAGGRGLWLDHRSRTFCRLAGEVELAALPLGPLSPSALPPLLLGRLPVPPADASGVGRRPLGGGAGEDWSFHDAAGRRWGAVVKDGTVLSWTLWQPGAAAPLLSWVAAAGAGSGGAWAELTDRRKGVRVRWRQVLREPLRPSSGSPGPPGPPAAVPGATAGMGGLGGTGGTAGATGGPGDGTGQLPLPAPYSGYREVVCSHPPAA